MCKLKSVIVLKDRVYVPEHDSHDRALEELNIKDTRENAESKFVRAELLPTNGDVFSPIETWALNVDQDIRPDWFFEEVEGSKVIAAVKKWAEEHIFINRHNLKLAGTQSVYVKDCTILSMWDSSTVKVMRGSSSVKVMRDSSTATLLYKHNSNPQETVVLCEDSTFKDFRTKTIYCAEGWKLVEANGKQRTTAI